LGVNGHLKSGNAAETPGGIGDRLDQVAFALADGTEFFLVIADVLLIHICIVSVKEDGTAAEARFNGVEGGFRLAFRTFGAGRELSVGLVCTLFRWGDAGEGLGFRRVGGSRSWELMRVHTRLKRSTREGENELRGVED
jgi:hypothetical protein